MDTFNKTLTDADTEYSQALSQAAQYVTVQCRTSAAMRGAFVTGKVANPTAPYFTIKADGAVTLPVPPSTSVTLYLASSSAGVVAEIIESEQPGS